MRLKKKKNKKKIKISGLKKLSDITFNILKGNKEKKDKQNLDITLLYFYYIQQVMDYIKDDFNNMQALITNVKNNKQLQIEGKSRLEFIKTYKFIFGSFNKEVEKEVKMFNEASYYTFNSDRLSEPKDRQKYLDINDDEKDLYEKRNRLLEFISYIYIIRKNDMENYLYYIEQIGELIKYHSDSKSSEAEAEGEEEGGEGEEEESRAAYAPTAADAPTATESTVAEEPAPAPEPASKGAEEPAPAAAAEEPAPAPEPEEDVRWIGTTADEGIKVTKTDGTQVNIIPGKRYTYVSSASTREKRIFRKIEIIGFKVYTVELELKDINYIPIVVSFIKIDKDGNKILGTYNNFNISNLVNKEDFKLDEEARQEAERQAAAPAPAESEQGGGGQYNRRRRTPVKRRR